MSLVNATMGIKALYYAPVGSDPKVMPTSGFKAVDVYQDTCSLVDQDPTITTHKSETSSKKLTQKTREASQLKFSLMDPTIDELVAFEGGVKSGTTGSEVYSEPESAVFINLAFKIIPQAGKAINISSATVSAKKNITLSSKGITLLEITAVNDYGIKFDPDLTAPTA